VCVYLIPPAIDLIVLLICLFSEAFAVESTMFGVMAGCLTVWLFLGLIPFIPILIVLNNKISNRKRKIGLYHLEQKYDHNK